MPASLPGPLERSPLLAVARLDHDAYGLAVRRDVADRMRHDYSVGTDSTTLRRLEDKGLVSSRTTDPLPARGGRSRRRFTRAAAGRGAQRGADHVAASVWAGVGTPIHPEPA